MGRGLVFIKDRYFEWSTIVDAPVTYSMTKEKLNDYIKEEYGNSGLRSLNESIDMCNKYGTSFKGGGDVYDVIKSNRAGLNESELSYDELYNVYYDEESYKKYYTKLKDA